MGRIPVWPLQKPCWGGGVGLVLLGCMGGRPGDQFGGVSARAWRRDVAARPWRVATRKGLQFINQHFSGLSSEIVPEASEKYAESRGIVCSNMEYPNLLLYN